jgi:HEAT repeat protein
MKSRYFAVVLALGCVFSASTQSQVAIANGRRPTIEETLRGHNIQLTRPGLTEALHNADPEVRSLAAQKLAQDGAKDTISAISKALADEKVPETRTSLALALATLGDDQGLKALQDICRDPNMQPYNRLEAARFMIQHGQQEACLTTVVELLDRGTPDSRQTAAWIVPQLRDLSAEDSARVLQAALRALTANAPQVRSAASHALSTLKDSSVIPHLRAALASEQDQGVRSQMQTDLDKLEKERPKE